ncbi:hypothetical protein FRC00_013648, partial [Tulasnella sp. 408]
VLVLAGPPTDRMWEVFKGYAGRVRCLTFRMEEFAPSTISYFSSRLRSASDSPYLLPNLRRICFAPENLSTLPSIIQLLPPDLKAIELHLNMGSAWLTAATATQLANALSDRPLRRLASITIICEGSISMEQESLSPLFSLVQVQSNPEARELRKYKLIAEALSKVGQQTQLTKLIIKHPGTSLEAAAAMSNTIGSLFPGLRTLKFSFDLDLQDEIKASIIAGISSCHDLRSLEVGNSGRGFLTSHMVSEMSQWWPFMEEFGLVSYGRLTRNEVNTPLSTLYDIAQAWSTTLRLLNVLFDLEFEGFPPASEARAVKFRHLKSITVISSALHPKLQRDRNYRMAEFLVVITNPQFRVHELLDWRSSREYVLLNQRIKEIRDAQ